MKNIIYISLLLMPLLGTTQYTTQFEVVDGDTINYLDENNEKQDFWRVFGRMKRLPGYEPDQVVEQGNYENDIRQGLWEYFNVDGEIEFTSFYINGVDTVNSTNNHLQKNFYIKHLLENRAILKEQYSIVGEENAKLKEANKQHQTETEDANQIKYTLFVFIGLLSIIVLILYSAYRKNRAS